ncbi:MAG: transposase [Deltaproteobacteria bacterium RBG_16_49_23]|nr:MAG: transposase [Deltaproteobacteria bacterium RBG_16_49_23]
MTHNKPLQIELTVQQVQALIDRGEQRSFAEQDYPIVLTIIRNYFALDHAHQEKSYAILRLLNRFFGRRTEKAREVLKRCSPEQDLPASLKTQGESSRESPKGHGRNGASAYEGAQKVCVPHSCYKAGDRCPLCPKGKLYPFGEPGVEVRIVGRAPLDATVYELEKLRCNLCGKVFTAPVPEEAGEDKYDETAGAMVTLLRYGSGLPFNRLEKLQDSLGLPLAASTQWEMAEKTADKIYPAYDELIRQAAQSNLFYHDDTLMKILANLKEIETEDERSRKGSFTTGVLAMRDERPMALFFTGPNHAGENLAKLLKQRASGLSPPIQMCDAASRNVSKEFETLLANCLAHARRNFVDLVPNFPEECRYVIEALAEIYHHDKMAKEQGLSSDQRLRFHQDRSGPVMERLNEWLQKQLDQRKVEPNSSMGKAIAYMLNHWEPLTLFLRVPGAPLDNNLCEQALKRAILHRKNSLFFRTEHGAYIGDLFMSLIHTCTLNRVNPFHYLTTLQRHTSELFKNPKRWLPWNYQQAATNPA